VGRTYESIDDEMREWIAAQHLFFVATAPLAADGHVNLSPKGLDTFAVLGPREVAYLDLTGSGVETVAHLRENGRITLLFSAFEGRPRIVRLYGRGAVVEIDDPEYAALAARFGTFPSARAVIRVAVSRIADSCGYGVPRFEYAGERPQLPAWASRKGPDALRAYRAEKNAVSIDGLPALKAR
jgi:hypothetical protein